MLFYRKKQIQFLAEKELIEEKFKSQLTKSQLEISEQTMTQISREIHDNTCQKLSLALMYLRSLEEQNKASDLSEIKTIISNSIDELRNLSHSLHTNFISELGLDLALEREVELINKIGHVKGGYAADLKDYQLTDEVEIILYRCVQELINNSLKHAQGTELNVKMYDLEDQLCLEVSDNGVGISEQARNGIGIKNIHERLALINGEFSFQSGLNSGTLALISVKKPSKTHTPHASD